MIWTRSQRQFLIAFVLVLCAVLLVRLKINRAYVSDPPPPRGLRADELASEIDPNVATWQELAALPQLGEKTAKSFVEWRERYVAEHNGELPFRKPEDLLKVKGIGASTLETLRPHLMFPASVTRAATRPIIGAQ